MTRKIREICSDRWGLVFLGLNTELEAMEANMRLMSDMTHGDADISFQS